MLMVCSVLEIKINLFCTKNRNKYIYSTCIWYTGLFSPCIRLRLSYMQSILTCLKLFRHCIIFKNNKRKFAQSEICPLTK